MEALSRKLDNLNVYDQVEFKQKFMQSKIYKMIDAEAEIIIWEKNDERALYEFTPRHQFWFKIATMQSCYYIDLMFICQLFQYQILTIGCLALSKFLQCVLVCLYHCTLDAIRHVECPQGWEE